MLVSLPAAATGSDVGAATMEGVKRFGKDALADLARFGGNRARSISTATQAFQGAPVGQASGFAVTAGPRAPTMAPALAQPAQPAYDQTRGHELEGNIRSALTENPQALGPYAERLQTALESADSSALSAEIFKLSNDPQFRARYMPMLQQGATP
jgi:hypothetical protein